MENQVQQPLVSAQSNTAPFAQSLQKENQTMNSKKVFIPLVVVVLFLGLGTGFVGASLTSTKSSTSLVSQSETTTETGSGEQTTKSIKVGQVVGAKDASAFKDTVEGVLVSGGVSGEGSHHIVRVGGASQNVYLTSSTMDLKEFEGAKVKVSGETFKAQKAGWLMDVGRLEVKELNAALPDGAAKQEDLLPQD